MDNQMDGMRLHREIHFTLDNAHFIGNVSLADACDVLLRIFSGAEIAHMRHPARTDETGISCQFAKKVAAFLPHLDGLFLVGP